MCRNDLLPCGLPAVENEQCEAAVIAKSRTETAARNVCPTRRLEPADEAILCKDVAETVNERFVSEVSRL